MTGTITVSHPVGTLTVKSPHCRALNFSQQHLFNLQHHQSGASNRGHTTSASSLFTHNAARAENSPAKHVLPLNYTKWNIQQIIFFDRWRVIKLPCKPRCIFSKWILHGNTNWIMCLFIFNSRGAKAICSHFKEVNPSSLWIPWIVYFF